MKKEKKRKRFRKTRLILNLGKFAIFIINSASLIIGISALIKKGKSLADSRKHK